MESVVSDQALYISHAVSSLGSSLRQTVAGLKNEEVNHALACAGMTPEEAEAIFRLTSLPTYEERFVVPPLKREQSIESTRNPLTQKREAGSTRFPGSQKEPARGW